jgi:hypothetical protein
MIVGFGNSRARLWNYKFKRGKITEPYLELEIRVSNQEHRNLTELRPSNTVEKDKSNLVEDLPVADLFTYFDCTDYRDNTLQEGSQSEQRE